MNQNVKSSLLKLYSSDIGLLTSQYGNAMKSKILLGDKKINLGGLDFVIEHDLGVVPIEVKSGKDYYVHSAISKAVNNSEYDINVSSLHTIIRE